MQRDHKRPSGGEVNRLTSHQLPDIRADTDGRVAITEERINERPGGGKDGADDPHADGEGGHVRVVGRIHVGPHLDIGRVLGRQEAFDLDLAHQFRVLVRVGDDLWIVHEFLETVKSGTREILVGFVHDDELLRDLHRRTSTRRN